MMDFDIIDKKIDDSIDDMKRDLARLVRFRSIDEGKDNQKSSEAINPEIKGVLEEALLIAESFGFKSTNADYKYGFADWNCDIGGDNHEKKLIGVLGHLDVVPANADEWESDPFELIESFTCCEQSNKKTNAKVEDTNKETNAKAEDANQKADERQKKTKLVGRGVIDDKGPMIAALYAAKSLKDAGLNPRHTLRFIFGVNEETRMDDMRAYKIEQQLPNCGFTPDADWPIIIGEKGICQFKLRATWDENCRIDYGEDFDIDYGENCRIDYGEDFDKYCNIDCDKKCDEKIANICDEIKSSLPRLISLSAGSVANAVPARAVATFEVKNKEEFIKSLVLNELEIVEARTTDAGATQVCVVANGVAAHGSTPQLAKNALTKLVRKLANVEFAPEGAKKFIDMIARTFEDECYGSGIAASNCESEKPASVEGVQESGNPASAEGVQESEKPASAEGMQESENIVSVAGKDENSVVTAAPTICRINENGGELTVDMRFLLSKKKDKYEKILETFAEQNKLKLEILHSEDPIYMPPETPLVQKLLSAYKQVTGDTLGSPQIIGGGTYAKMLPNFVAFGMEPKDSPMRAHSTNEYVTVDELITATKIYARAIYNLIS